MAQRINNYAEDGIIRLDVGGIAKSTPSHEGVISGEAASNEELQQDKVDLDAMYDFLYGDEDVSKDIDTAEGADENKVITDAPADSAWTQALDVVSSNLAGVGLDAPLPQVLQGEAILGGTTVEDLNLMMQLHHEESLMQSGKVPWYTPEYRALFEEGVRLKKIVPLGDHLLPLQPPTVPKESVGSEASMAMSAMYPSGGGEMPIEARLKYALLVNQKQKLKRLRVALQLHTEKLMVMTTWEEVAKVQCSLQVQHLGALGNATLEGMAFKQKLRVAEDAHKIMVAAEWGRHGEWLIQQQLKWNVEEAELALLLLQNQLNDAAASE